MFYIYPTYSSIYNQPVPSFKEILLKTDIPVNLFLKVVLYINAQLSNNTNDEEIDIFLFNSFFKRIPNEEKLGLLFNKQKCIKDGNKMLLFNRLCVIELIHLLLLNFEYKEIVRDTTPDDELLLFQMILIANESRTGNYDPQIKEGFSKAREANDYFFQRMNWTIFVKQTDIVHNTNYFYESFRTMSVINNLHRKDKYKIYVNQYLKSKNINFSWEFVFYFLRLYIEYRANREEGDVQFSFEAEKKSQLFLDNLCLDIIDYKQKLTKHNNYIGLREKPLIKFGEKYYILDWIFLSNQVYIGFLFDFYKNSGIDVEFKRFIDFKSFIGYEISEKSFFLPIMNEIYKKKKGCVSIGGMESNFGLPDFYVRTGKYVFLFEFKDSLMSNQTQSTYNFDIIRNQIEETFIKSKRGQEKALFQLSNYISNINENKYWEYDNHQAKGIKTRNLVIYPIIIYTDYKYEISGVNDYLNQYFKSILKVRDNIQVKDITVINLEFLFTNLSKFRDRIYDLQQLIDNYHSKIKSEVKRYEKTHDKKLFPNLYRSFESFHYKLYPSKPDNKSMKALFYSLALLDEEILNNSDAFEDF